MAFNPLKKQQSKVSEKNPIPNVPEGLEASNEVNEDSTINFLEPKRDAVKDSMNDPYQAEMTQKSAYQYTLKTLNALKIVSPIISAIMQRPNAEEGAEATNEAMTETFRTLITEVSNLAQAVCEKMEVDPTKERNFWIRNVLEKSFSDILHNQWVKQGKIDTSLIENVIDEIIKFSETTSEKSQYDEIAEESLVKLATIKSMLPILHEAQNFSLYRNMEEDIEPIMKKLFEASAQAVTKLADDYADEKDRAKLFYMIMQEAGSLYATSWKAEGKRIDDIMKKYTPEKLKSSIDKYQSNGGFPLNKIETDFDKYFVKMLVITDKLIISQKGSIQKRLNKK